jgi:carboxyl-terminal processing protease
MLPQLSGQRSDDPCNQASTLLGMLNKYHLSPPELNAITSAEVFDDFIQRLDPANCIFISTDIASLQSYKTILLNTTSNQQVCKFLEVVSALYISGLYRADSLVSAILLNPIDFNKKDSILFLKDYEANFASDKKELENRWLKRLKFMALNMMFTPVSDEDPLKMEAFQLLLKESEIRKKLVIRERRTNQRILEYPSGSKAYITELFLNTIANRYDPHTLYFSPQRKESFISSLSREAMSFGISFTENKNGEVMIDNLVPGGPAWKSNQLNPGDFPIQIQWPKGEGIDLSWSSLEEVEQIITQSGYNTMELSVRKANGLIVKVRLTKEVINVEENSITGYVLTGEKKVGYISMPDFYTDGEMQDAPGCSNDVAKEIIKLQKEGIEGLILDLRYNGGGSLQEALGLMGIFIDQGPLFMAREKGQKPHVFKDLNRGVVYSGPLVVMVNGFSASASELVTAGLRDYNRALVVGCTTFGKAIAQVTLPLDTNINFSKERMGKKSSAFVNVTIEQIYRINGNSYQKTGIQPDIVLPELYDDPDLREAGEPYSIGADKIDKKVIYLRMPELPVSDLAEKSNARTSPLQVFNKIKYLSDSLQNIEKSEALILTLENFRQYKSWIKELEDRISALNKTSSAPFTAGSTMYDAPVLVNDNHRKELTDNAIGELQTDIYVSEVYSIMNDFISLMRK